MKNKFLTIIFLLASFSLGVCFWQPLLPGCQSNYQLHQRAINELQVATVFINKHITGYIQGYHSGHKTSGGGGEDGVYGIQCHMQKRTVYMDYSE